MKQNNGIQSSPREEAFRSRDIPHMQYRDISWVNGHEEDSCRSVPIKTSVSLDKTPCQRKNDSVIVPVNSYCSGVTSNKPEQKRLNPILTRHNRWGPLNLRSRYRKQSPPEAGPISRLDAATSPGKKASSKESMHPSVTPVMFPLGGKIVSTSRPATGVRSKKGARRGACLRQEMARAVP